ncbi:hypothetical protein BHM03_00006716 [Ensete ventricosum]|nr:hypothetical protein BHM03_00006716 [Ensete ventricosum]
MRRCRSRVAALFLPCGEKDRGDVASATTEMNSVHRYGPFITNLLHIITDVLFIVKLSDIEMVAVYHFGLSAGDKILLSPQPSSQSIHLDEVYMYVSQGLQFRFVLPYTGYTYRSARLSVHRPFAIGTTKIDRRRPIEGEIDRRRSIEEEKGKKKKKRKRRKRKKRRRRKKYLLPRAVAALACGRFFSRARRWNISP